MVPHISHISSIACAVDFKHVFVCWENIPKADICIGADSHEP